MGANSFAIIMAGGKGERFWPLSSRRVPKPFIPLFGEKTMIQDTVGRIARFIPSEKILVVLSPHHLAVAREQLPQLPESNFVVEPVGKDTAACIGLASLHVERMAGDARVVILAADHRIRDEDSFVRDVSGAINFIGDHNCIITIGIRPVRPDTGYGYIERGEELGRFHDQAFYQVLRFVEKPDLSRAESYITSGRHYWNSGMFIAKNKTIQEEIEAFMPELWEGLQRIRQAWGRDEADEVMRGEFDRFRKISFDYGVLEQSERIALVPASFDWDDIGTWNALERVCNRDQNNNVIRGRHIGFDTRGCIIYNKEEEVIVSLGVQDLVIVKAQGKVFVSHKNRVSSLKEIIPMIEEQEE